MPSSQDPFNSARIKIDRAKKHIAETSELIRESRPFRYTIETDAQRLERSIGVERNCSVIDHISVVCGDAVHNLRAALDHAYFTVVSPHVPAGRGAKNIQFPASATAAGLYEAVRNRKAHEVGPEFFGAVMALKPHGEAGGNELLYLIHEIDIPDKHSSLIPTADYTVLRGDEIRRQVSDCPISPDSEIHVSENGRDIVWPCRPDFLLHKGAPTIGTPAPENSKTKSISPFK